MSTYYINANVSDTSIYPYTQDPVYGAKDFDELFGAITLKDGDVVSIYFPIGEDDVDNTSLIDRYTLDAYGSYTIPCGVTINAINDANSSPAIPAVVNCSRDSYLFKFNNLANNVSVTGLRFHRVFDNDVLPEMYPVGSCEVLVFEGSYNTAINNCHFSYDVVGLLTSAYDENSLPMCIYLNGCINSKVTNCNFQIPSLDCNEFENFNGVAVVVNACVDIQILNNFFDGSKGIGCAIKIVGSTNIDISQNIIVNFNNLYGHEQSFGDGIINVASTPIVTIRNNVISSVDTGYFGIKISNAYPSSSDALTNKLVQNNTILLKSDSTNCGAVLVAGFIGANVKIINNNIATDDNDINHNAKALNVALSKSYGVIDYNNIWNISLDNEFYRPYYSSFLMSACGSHTIRVNPQLPCINDSETYSISAFDSYICSARSAETIGSGTEYTNIGCESVDGYLCMVDSMYVSDSDVKVYETTSIYKPNYIYKNDVVSTTVNTSAQFANNVTDSFYNMQFGWIPIDSTPFPFTTNSPFFGKDDKYVYMMRNDLSPFTNIECPPNPGYGFVDGYVGYPTGLFGNSRADWVNGCTNEDPCVIQNMVSDQKQIYKLVETTKSIQNTITPPCEE